MRNLQTSGHCRTPWGAMRFFVRLARQGYLWRDLRNIAVYGFRNAPYSFERIWVSPALINNIAKTQFKREDSALVLGGDWDLAVTPFDTAPKVLACRRHFERGLSWEDAGIFELMKRQIDQRGVFDGCRTLEDIRRRYQRIDRLYEYLRAGGEFRSSSELGESSLREKGGVRVHIGRGGELLFGSSGYHRLIIAKLLDLKIIPAQIGVVHAEAAARGIVARLRAPAPTC